jgi:hypothetical protein
MAAFINSFPKSGTNLLHKALELLGYKYARLGIADTLLRGRYPLLRRLVRSNPLDWRKVNIGLYTDAPVGSIWLRYRLTHLGRTAFITGHTRYSQEFAALLERCDVQPLIVIRDPRDVLISHARYIPKRRDIYLGRMLSGQLDSDLLRVLEGDRSGEVVVRPFAEAYDEFLPWVDKYSASIVRFEDLVGAPGGGTAEAQGWAIERICKLLGRTATKSDLRVIRDCLFGGTRTFSVGQAEAWRGNEAFRRIERQFYRVMKPVLDRLGYA